MMTDLDHIRHIEHELGVQLWQVNMINYNTKGYVLNGQNQVIRLGLDDLGIKRLESIIYAISSLVSLQELSLDTNQISDLDPLSSLVSLQELSLNNNQISDLEPLRSLMSLQTLWLIGNQISDLDPLRSVVSLQKLKLNFNQISNLDALRSLVSLQALLLDHNQISDLEPLRSLVSLQALSLGHNQISDLEPLMALNALNILRLSYNPIKILPKSITYLPIDIQWKDTSHDIPSFITFFDNPLESPPPEIVAQGKEAVKNYFSSLEKAASEGKALVRLQEVKVHLVGEGLAGKTSLLKQLQGLPFSVHESQTHGINVLSLTAS